MFDNIVQSFLRNSINDGLYGGGYLIFLDIELRRDLYTRITLFKFSKKPINGRQNS